MRDRREFIKVGGSTLALGVAGCVHRIPEEGDESDGSEDEGGEAMDGEKPEEEPDNESTEGDQGREQEEEPEEEETEPASFTVSDTSLPSTTQIGTDFNWSFTVENEGGEEGTYTTTVSRRKDEGAWREVAEVELDIAPGEQETYTETDSIDFVGAYDYRVDEANRRLSIDAEERELDFEKYYTNPDGIRVAVQSAGVSRDIRVTKGYTYEQGEDRAIERASDGSQFALVNMEARNPTREVIDLPRRDEFVISVGGDDYETVEYLGQDAYQGGESRTQKRGVIAFEISDRHQRGSTFDVFWVRRYPRGRAAAVWSTTNE